MDFIGDANRAQEMNHGFIVRAVTKAAAGRKARSLTIRSHMASCSSMQLPFLYYTFVVSLLEHPNKVSVCLFGVC